MKRNHKNIWQRSHHWKRFDFIYLIRLFLANTITKLSKILNYIFSLITYLKELLTNKNTLAISEERSMSELSTVSYDNIVIFFNTEHIFLLLEAPNDNFFFIW